MTQQGADQTNPHDQRTQIALLAMRVDNLGKEKEGIERDLERERAERENYEKETDARILKIEGSLDKGAGILIGLAAVGTIGGGLLAYGKAIFAPWFKP